jgi:hypothetical protein
MLECPGKPTRRTLRAGWRVCYCKYLAGFTKIAIDAGSIAYFVDLVRSMLTLSDREGCKRQNGLPDGDIVELFEVRGSILDNRKQDLVLAIYSEDSIEGPRRMLGIISKTFKYLVSRETTDLLPQIMEYLPREVFSKADLFIIDEEIRALEGLHQDNLEDLNLDELDCHRAEILEEDRRRDAHRRWMGAWR